MNLVAILNAVLGEAGFLERTSFADSPDPDDKQMVHMANRVVEDIRTFYPWSSLVKTHHVDIVTGQDRYPLPADYYSVVADSAWETDGSRKCDFPVPRNRWFMYKFSSLTDAGTIRARLYGDEIELHDPSVSTGFDLEYVTRYLVTDSGGNPKPAFTKDTDLFILEDDMLIKGVMAKWGMTKMMPQTQEWKREYMDELRYQVGRDNSAQTIGGVGPRVDRRSPYYPLWRRTP
jgi:hypothetical protein